MLSASTLAPTTLQGIQQFQRAKPKCIFCCVDDMNLPRWPHYIGLWGQLKFLAIQIEANVWEFMKVGAVLQHKNPSSSPRTTDTRRPCHIQQCRIRYRCSSSSIFPIKWPSSMSAQAGAAIREVPLSTIAAQPCLQTLAICMWSSPSGTFLR